MNLQRSISVCVFDTTTDHAYCRCHGVDQACNCGTCGVGYVIRATVSKSCQGSG